MTQTRFARTLDQRGITQAQVSKGTGIPRQTVNAIYLGKRTPKTGIGGRIARFLGVTIDELFGEEDGADGNSADEMHLRAPAG